MQWLIVSEDEPKLSVVSALSDEVLEEASNGDIEIIQVTKKGKFEKLDADTGMFLEIEERE